MVVSPATLRPAPYSPRAWGRALGARDVRASPAAGRHRAPPHRRAAAPPHIRRAAPRRLKRRAAAPQGLGWLLTRRLWGELKGKWPDEKGFWDDW